MRILVSGGLGFVGTAVTEQLVASGHDVFVVDDESLGTPENLMPETRQAVETVRADIRDAESLAAAVGGWAPQAVIHLAAIHFIPLCDANPKLAVDVNAGGTQAMLDACAATSSIDRIVFASTGAVYAPDEAPHSEDSTIGPTDIYGHTKLWGEQLVAMFHARTEIAVRVARLFNVYGPGETNPHLIPTVLRQAALGDELRLGNLTTLRDYVFTDDVARGIEALAVQDLDPTVTVNLGSEHPVSGTELLELVGEHLGRTLQVATDPSRVRKSDRPLLQSDCRRAASLLGWRAEMDIADGIARALEQPVARGIAFI